MTQARRPWLSLAVLCLGTFAILLDTTIVNVALPSMITGLHASLDQALWVVNAYLLVFCSLLIMASRLGDMFGPRRLFSAGLAVFAVASALCGAAQSPGQLIAARVLQGIGAAALTPQAMVIIQAVFPRERMGAAFGVFSSMVGLAAVSGPVLGGVLTTYLGWRWVVYVNLPIAAAAARAIPQPHVRDHGHAESRRAVRAAEHAAGQCDQPAVRARLHRGARRAHRAAADRGADRGRPIRRAADRPAGRQVRADGRAGRLRARHRRGGGSVVHSRYLADLRPGAAGRRAGHGRDLRSHDHHGHASRSAGAGRRRLWRTQHRAAARRGPWRRGHRLDPGHRAAGRGSPPIRGQLRASRPIRLAGRPRSDRGTARWRSRAADPADTPPHVRCVRARLYRQHAARPGCPGRRAAGWSAGLRPAAPRRCAAAIATGSSRPCRRRRRPPQPASSPTRKDAVMTGQISRHRDIDALKVAAQWPDADRATVVNLAARLAAVGADADGYRFFAEQADVHPGEPLWLSLAGFFQARTGSDVDAAIAKLDWAADRDLGLPQYFRGQALAALPPDPQRAERAVADLTFVLAVRDQFPVALIRAAHHGLARAYAMLGKDDLAAAAVSDSGLAGLPEDSGLQFGGYWATARDDRRARSR